MDFNVDFKPPLSHNKASLKVVFHLVYLTLFSRLHMVLFIHTKEVGKGIYLKQIRRAGQNNQKFAAITGDQRRG